MTLLNRDFYERDASSVARDLLGMTLVHHTDTATLSAVITETEAYLGADDPACHSFGLRRTHRTEIMYGHGGFAYIYLVYGMHRLLNAVTGKPGDPCAVLIRAALPLSGREDMAILRFHKPYDSLSNAQKRALCDGPGKLSAALGLSLAHNGLDLCSSQLGILSPEHIAAFSVRTAPRIGVDYAGDAAAWPLRFIADYPASTG